MSYSIIAHYTGFLFLVLTDPNIMYLMADSRFRAISHRSEVLSDQQWDTIALLRPELIRSGRPWPSNGQLFEGILWLLGSTAGWQDLRPHTLAHQPVGLDCVIGKKTGPGYRCGAG